MLGDNIVGILSVGKTWCFTVETMGDLLRPSVILKFVRNGVMDFNFSCYKKLISFLTKILTLYHM